MARVILPDGALAQLRRIAAQPYVVDHVAAMPDAHVASGIAVGTVFAARGAVVPAALGGDLGCGMSAVPLGFPASGLSRSDLDRIVAAWAEFIPVDAWHRPGGPPIPEPLAAAPLSTHALEHERARLLPRHLGTLGGGNHFVELDRDAGGEAWLLVHSGSRGLGSAIAAHHLRAAQAQGRGELPGLDADGEAGRACLGDIAWALAFARANRDALVAAAASAVFDVVGAGEPGERIDVHHNFVVQEEHLGELLWVHRKGAIAAPLGVRALIPGSMGTASYVVEGLGEASSFHSGSHGTGRVMTRTQARARIGRARLVHAMRRVAFDGRRAAAMVEEAPEAYRDIREVLEDEADLVRPVLRLEPIAVLKG